MPTIREILATENPELKLRWKGTTYNNTQSKTDSYDSVIFNDIQNSTVKKCMSLITYYISQILTLMSILQGMISHMTRSSSLMVISSESI